MLIFIPFRFHGNKKIPKFSSHRPPPKTVSSAPSLRNAVPGLPGHPLLPAGGISESIGSSQDQESCRTSLFRERVGGDKGAGSSVVQCSGAAPPATWRLPVQVT